MALPNFWQCPHVVLMQKQGLGSRGMGDVGVEAGRRWAVHAAAPHTPWEGGAGKISTNCLKSERGVKAVPLEHLVGTFCQMFASGS